MIALVVGLTDSRKLVDRQRRILVELRDDGLPTVAAEQLPGQIEDAQRLHEEHLARLTGNGSD